MRSNFSGEGRPSETHFDTYSAFAGILSRQRLCMLRSMHKLPSKSMRDRARQLRSGQTVFERRLWYRLKILNKHGAQFRRQVPFANYILDFADHSARLVIELDGSQHGEAENRLRDEKRDRMLTAEGYLVLRFANYEITEDADAVAEAIERTALQRRRDRWGATGVK